MPSSRLLLLALFAPVIPATIAATVVIVRQMGAC
jgi:hypothetical protein